MITLARVLLYVKAHPGCTTAEVAGEFLTSCTIAGAHLRALRGEGVVTSRGKTRGTRYYPRKARPPGRVLSARRG